jgi:pimeloyl-ACP methyl ester carboxylesterase
MSSNKDTSRPADFIVPLDMNGLHGRMARLPAPAGKKREILFIYGHHSSLERWWGLIRDLNQYGSVTVPDLPGFGGMDSFYKIGEKPTLDAYADYLAAFIKLQYKRKKVSIAALSFGFIVVTRMLQRYPDLVGRVDLLVSVVGFAHKDDFSFSRTRHALYRYGAGFFGYRLPAVFFRNVILSPLVLRLAYAKTHNAKKKFEGMSPQDIDAIMDFEIYLWHANEIRTYMRTTVAMLTLDNCKKQVSLPLYHISVKADRYFDAKIVDQHLRVIYSSVTEIPSTMDSHAPSIIADLEESAPIIPPGIRKLLNET